MWALPLLAAAQEWGTPPVTALGRLDATWTVDDSLLAAAYMRYKAERVGPSGYPWRVVSEDTGNWNVEEKVDYAQAALDKWAEQHKDDRKPGSSLRVFWHEIVTPAMRRARKQRS